MSKHYESRKLTELGERILDKYHEDKARYARFKFVFVTKAKGYAAKIGKISSVYQALGVDGDYVIIVNKEVWDLMNKSQRKAMLDHELCHAVVEYDDEKDSVKFKLRHHDCEEFNEIVERHGLWRQEVKTLLHVCKNAKKKKKGKKNGRTQK